MRVLFRVWLDKDGKAFGEGPYNLLKEIEKTGSLSKAAKNLGISYKKAWIIINNCEKRLGFRLLEKKTGGKKGGGSLVTQQGKIFLEHYEEFREDVKKSIERAFRKHFAKNTFGIKTGSWRGTR